MSGLRTQLSLLRRMHWTMNAAVGALLVIGVMFIYSSCYISEELPVRAYYRKQMIWALAGIAVYLVFALIDYRKLRKVSWWLYAGSLLLLAVVLVSGEFVSEDRRRLMLLGVGVQPSELAKLALIIVLARKLSLPGVNLAGIRPLLPILAIVAVPFFMIVEQPDLGTAMVLIPTSFAMIFVAGVPWKAIGVLLLVALIGVGVFLGALFLPEKLGVSEEGQNRILRLCRLRPYHKERILVFFAPGREPLVEGWNKVQSEIAVGSGGAWGKGFLKGTQNILGFLPRTVARTDFIFSVIAEEKGFFGSVVVLLLFGWVMVSGLMTALAAHDKMGRLMCVGIVVMIFCHVFVNIAMTVGLMPITGLPLPLLSYGGSFTIVMMSALGILQSVHLRSHEARVVFEQESFWRTG